MTLRFVQITDHHLGADATTINRGYSPAWALDRVLTAIASADAHHADFLVCTGDLVDRGDDVEYAFAARWFGYASAESVPGPLSMTRPGLEDLPLYVVPGNHDPREAFTRNLFPGTPATSRLDVAWRVGDVAFVYLDTGLNGREGVLADGSLHLLDTVLERGAPVVVVLHHHPVEVGIPWLDRAVLRGVERLWERVRGGGIVDVLFGHSHATIHADVAGVPVLGLRSTCFQFGATDEPSFVIQPLQYRLVTIAEEGLSSQVFEVPLTGEPEGKLRS